MDERPLRGGRPHASSVSHDSVSHDSGASGRPRIDVRAFNVDIEVAIAHGLETDDVFGAGLRRADPLGNATVQVCVRRARTRARDVMLQAMARESEAVSCKQT